MSGADFLALCKAARSRIRGGRYRHSVSVARTADKLAAHYRAPALKARVAGILHDVARLRGGEELLAFAQAHSLPISDEARRSPVLLHARVGAEIARLDFNVDDPEILGAIARHTIAGPGMTVLEKILYIADTIEPSRTFAGREALEAAAYRSLDEGLLACIRESITYLAARNVPVAQETIQLHDLLVKRDAPAT